MGKDKIAELSDFPAGLFCAGTRSLAFANAPGTALSKARTKGRIDPISGTVTIAGVAVMKSKLCRLGVGEAKLLSLAVSAFARKNARNARHPILRVVADTRDFARANGIRFEPEPKATVEAQEKEDRRAAKAFKNFVAQVGRNARNLQRETTFSWSEGVGHQQRYCGISLFGAFRITSRSIMLEFSQSFADYLVRRPLVDVPRSLYAIANRTPNAFAIAFKLLERFGMDANLARGTEGRLKVESLLRCTSFPSHDELRRNRWSFMAHVKQPFEAALDELTNKGFLRSWRYACTGGRELSKNEAANVRYYEPFAALTIHFDLAGYDSREERIAHLASRREARAGAVKRPRRPPSVSARPEPPGRRLNEVRAGLNHIRARLNEIRTPCVLSA